MPHEKVDEAMYRPIDDDQSRVRPIDLAVAPDGDVVVPQEFLVTHDDEIDPADHRTMMLAF